MNLFEDTNPRALKDLLGEEILEKIRQNLPRGSTLESLRFTASGEPG